MFTIGMFSVINLAHLFVEPLTYLGNVYQMLFGSTPCIPEVPKGRTMTNVTLRIGQKVINEYCKFLTTFEGIGLFYLLHGVS